MPAPPLAPEIIERRLKVLAEHDGNTSSAARFLGITRSALQNTVAAAERVRPNKIQVPGRLHLTVHDGIVLVGSDAHYHPGIISTAHRAFVHFCRELKPSAVIVNGDMLDGATISRHPPIGWETRPSLAEELETVKERLNEIVVAADSALRYWPGGNHDLRFETKIASSVPEFAKVQGIHLHDHISDWERCWSVWINNSVVVTHRARGGIHATHNNVVNAGMSIVTGHLHSLKVSPFSDYRDNVRFGIDCGTLASPYGPQFTYLEDNFRNWRSGFVVLTFRDGKLMWPEIVHAVDEEAGRVDFRGDYITV